MKQYFSIITLVFIIIFVSCSDKNAEQLIERGEYLKAADILTESIREEPEKKTLLTLMKVNNNHLGKYTENIELYNEYEEMILTDRQLMQISAVSLCNYGFEEYENENYTSARQYASAAGQLDENYGRPKLLKAKVFLKRSSIDSAYYYLNRSVECDSTLKESYLLLGNIAQMNEEFDHSMAMYDRAIALDSAYAGAWTNRGALFYSTENYQYAVHSFKEAIKYDSLNILAYDYLINLYYNAGLVDSAKRYADIFQRNKEELDDNTDR
ncbi:MAG: hypothetical protein SVK54_07005 [candidate division WOR-3 bacterium]|nr:hypothetical protein [candidate division WOR-3 bacterium]